MAPPSVNTLFCPKLSTLLTCNTPSEYIIICQANVFPGQGPNSDLDNFQELKGKKTIIIISMTVLLKSKTKMSPRTLHSTHPLADVFFVGSFCAARS